MSLRRADLIATVHVCRDREDGTFSVMVDLAERTETAWEFSTLEGAMTRAADIMRGDMRMRKTVPPPEGTGGGLP